MTKYQINRIFIHYGEIGLKGKNQPFFRKKLAKNIRFKLKNLGFDWPVKETRGYVEVTIPEKNENQNEHLLESLKHIPGIVNFEPAIGISFSELNLEKDNLNLVILENIISDLAAQKYEGGKTFCVRVRRGDKTFPKSSVELERQLGAAIFKNTKWNKVNLTQPDKLFGVNIQKDSIYFSCEKYKGCGGLPVGTVGRVLTLLSGGIDSPVAAYQMARRGCQVDFIHFTATNMQQQEATDYKITRLVQSLSQITLRSRLFLVPYIHFDMAMFGKNVEYELILFRRFMVRVAEELAGQIGAEVLVTGDNLAQVASQTMNNIVSLNKATNFPILRPLLTYDKQDIIDLAQKIDTYQLSIESYKDCCAIISRHPKTKSKHEQLEKIEKDIFTNQYAKLIEKTLEDAVIFKFKTGKLEIF